MARNEPNKTEHESTNGRSMYYGKGHLNAGFFLASGGPLRRWRRRQKVA